MQTRRISPPLRRQRLGRILRDLRTRENLSLAEAGKRLGWSTAKAARIETGQTKPTPADVQAALDLYGATPPVREECVVLAGQAAARPWWTPYRGVLGEYVSLETEAVLIRSWQPQLVEGLLQTEDYARAVIVAGLPGERPAAVETRVRARMARQERLQYDDAPMLSLVLHEDALRVPVGGIGVMRAQLSHLREMAIQPNITLRVLPRRIGAHPGMGGAFVLLTLPGDPVALFVEGGAPEEIITNKVAMVRDFERRFDHLAACALNTEESLTTLDHIAREFDAD